MNRFLEQAAAAERGAFELLGKYGRCPHCQVVQDSVIMCRAHAEELTVRSMPPQILGNPQPEGDPDVKP